MVLLQVCKAAESRVVAAGVCCGTAQYEGMNGGVNGSVEYIVAEECEYVLLVWKVVVGEVGMQKVCYV